MSSMNPVVSLMQKERRKWAMSTVLYGTLNVFFRIFLIAASAMVAAEKTIDSENSPIKVFVSWIPILAVAVTIAAGIDAWLKPRDKWRGFMSDRDELDGLINRGLISSDNPEAQLALDKEFQKLRRQHREKNVF